MLMHVDTLRLVYHMTSANALIQYPLILRSTYFSRVAVMSLLSKHCGAFITRIQNISDSMVIIPKLSNRLAVSSKDARCQC